MTDQTMEYRKKRTFSLELDDPFLLQGIRISSVQGIILAMVFAVVVASAFHTLNFIIHFRERHCLKRKTDWYHYVSTFYHMVSAFLAYVMVYCVMTYNVWLLVSILLGSGIGQRIIGPFISIYLEKRYLSVKNETNEIFTDLLPERVTPSNDNVDNGEITYPHSEHAGGDCVLKQGSMQIQLDDFLIHQPRHLDLKSDRSVNATPQIEEVDQTSEYDSLDGDIKPIQS
ncbi:uncharacterized protein LOC123525553 [Mercenaria mercenaria]|uniref:uncharacterized protein LOC123525553 n=1 Tax=Mercenaria mercenaria TaxID=6596 RepID=UPI00234F9C7E|nr:uncharacterized protein LOC123525553 [Mercenaria mercenaria]